MSNRRTHPGLGPRHPTCEGLEGRLLMAAEFSISGLEFGTFEVGYLGPGAFGSFSLSYLDVVATRPADGATLFESPTTLAVQFDRPLDPFSMFNDILLARVEVDGRFTPIFDDLLVPPRSISLTEPSVLLITLDRPLEPGQYRLILSGFSMLSGLDGSFLEPLGEDRPLADFTISRPGVSLADAENLGIVGTESRSVAGVLDFTTNPSAVALYRITLSPSDPLWRLALEIEAQRAGGLLDAALTLFDEHGRPIASSDDGRVDALKDPYLFSSLKPGTYYVGVSGLGNLPGQPGAYDPASGDPGTIVQDQPGGAFTLRLAADPVAGPTMRLGFRLNRADPSDPAPTGFDLQFSGPLRLGDSAQALGRALGAGLEVVDQAGRVWPIAGIGVSEVEARLTYLFRTRLPAGLYTVRVPASGGLADLSGRAPVAPGLPPGVLATFLVPGEISQGNDPLDFGPVYPDARFDGLSVSTRLVPGTVHIARFVVLHEDDLRLSGLSGEMGVEIELVRVQTGQSIPLARDPDPTSLNSLVKLAPGEYLIRLKTTGSEAVQADIQLHFAGRSFEALLRNGVGQGPALSLRLVAPTATSLEPDLPAVPAAPTPTPPSTGGAPYPAVPTPPEVPASPAPPPAAPLGPGTAPGYPGPAPTIAPGSTGAMGGLLSIATEPVGMPTADADQLTPVGPGEATALALNADDLLPAYLEGGLATGNDPALRPGFAAIEQDALTDGAILALLEGPAPPAANGPGSVPATQAATPQNNAMVYASPWSLARLVENYLVSLVAGWGGNLDGPSPGATESLPAEDGSITISAASESPPEDDLARGGLKLPLSLSLVAVLAFQFHEHLTRWALRLRSPGRLTGAQPAPQRPRPWEPPGPGNPQNLTAL